MVKKITLGLLASILYFIWGGLVFIGMLLLLPFKFKKDE